MRYSPSGQAITNFNLAANHQYTDSNGQAIKETTWFRVSVFARAAENCNQYLHKGRLVCDPETGGPLIYTRSARKDGAPGAAFEVNASIVRFLLGQESPDAQEGAQNSADPRYGDIPF